MSVMNTGTPIDVNIYAKEAYARYGSAVNVRRVVPNMYDGLKPVYRKLIISALSYPKDKFIDAVALVGECKGKYYLHGEASLSGVIDKLVQANIFEGEGAFGAATLVRDLPGAAMRYVKVRINPIYRQVIDDLLPYVPKFLNDLDNYEPMYLPVYIPLGLLSGSLGIGIGLAQRMPPMDPKSLVDAMLAKDYTKVESAFGFKLTNSEKYDFWNNSNFSFTYQFKWTKDAEGYHIYGDGSWVKPSYPPMYAKEDENKENPLYEIIDNFGENRSDVTLIPLSPLINDKALDKACKVRIGNILWVADPFNNSVKLVTGEEMIYNCLNKYRELYERWKSDKLARLNIELEAYANFKEVANLLINTSKSEAEITLELKLSSVEVVKTISGMSVGSLRKYDHAKKLKSIEVEIATVTKKSYLDNLDLIK